jgi:hypothetical protein
MAVSEESRQEHDPVIASDAETARKAASLAPLEERARRGVIQGLENNGSIVFDTGSLKLPKDFTEKEEGRRGFLGLEPITLLILAFSLLFIALMTYLIWTETPKTKDEPRPAAAEAAPWKPFPDGPRTLISIRPSRFEGPERGSSPVW